MAFKAVSVFACILIHLAAARYYETPRRAFPKGTSIFNYLGEAIVLPRFHVPGHYGREGSRVQNYIQWSNVSAGLFSFPLLR